MFRYCLKWYDDASGEDIIIVQSSPVMLPTRALLFWQWYETPRGIKSTIVEERL